MWCTVLFFYIQCSGKVMLYSVRGTRKKGYRFVFVSGGGGGVFTVEKCA